MQHKRPDNHRPLLYVLLKKFGVKGALSILREDIGFDLTNGINTAAPVSRTLLYPKSGRAEQNRYVPSTFAVLRAVLEYAGRYMDLADCGFIDIGSGKGKALFCAALYPFHSVRGIDVSPRMHGIATRNRRKLKLDSRVELMLGSAVSLEMRSRERVIYMFNPFTGDILQRFLDNIAASTRDGPGLLVYVNPTETLLVERHFQLIHSDYIQPGSCEVAYYALP